MTKEEPANTSLGKAQAAKEDEFYTRLEDIENELRHYKDHFKDKIVYCNCDDPRVSNFFHYFSFKFEQLGLKKLITTCYKNQEMDLFSRNSSERAIYLDYTGEVDGGKVPTAERIGVHELQGNGDFRSEECVELLSEADIVVTNPPFSLFRPYLSQLVQHEKKFLILGNQNAITYKEVFPLLMGNEVWLGHSSGQMTFQVPDDHKPKKTGFSVDEDGRKWRSFGNMCWLTNLDTVIRHEELILYETYSPEKYPRYANFDGIEVSRVANIPDDYDGPMGVPVTFLEKYNPDQFEILGTCRDLSKPMSEVAEKGSYQQGGPRFYLSNSDGTYRRLYFRIVIRRIR